MKRKVTRMELRFSKYHGAGNDFILFRQEDLLDLPLAVLARAVCHRHYGIGADGIMVASPSQVADIKMTIINADGSLAEMCGNGIRCFSRYVHEEGLIEKTTFSVETDAGILAADIVKVDRAEYAVRISMGKPNDDPQAIPMDPTVDPWNYAIELMEGEGVLAFTCSSLRMGVPHTMVWDVRYMDGELGAEAEGQNVEPSEEGPELKVSLDFMQEDLPQQFGMIIEHAGIFPHRTNVNFVKVLSDDRLQVNTWERGAGETLACGTGACASAFAAQIKGLVGRDVVVEVPGGSLRIEIQEDHEIFMTGPAALVSKGNFYFPAKEAPQSV